MNSTIDKLVQANDGWDSPPSTFKLVVIWFAISLFATWLFVAAADTHARPNFLWAMSRPQMLISWLGLALSTVMWVWACFAEAVPGKKAGLWIRRLGVLGLALPVLIALLAMFSSLGHELKAVGFDPLGPECSETVLFFAFIPTVVLFVMLRKLAPQRPLRDGARSALASGIFSAAILALLCPVSNPMHTLVFHYMPVILILGLGAAAGKKFLRW